MSIGFLEGREWVQVRGIKWWVHRDQFIDATLLSRGAWEPPTTVVFEKLVKAGMVVLDLGANTGYYTVLGSKLVGPTGSVLAVEAMDEPLEVLRQQCEANQCTNVSVAHAAVDDSNKLATETFFNYSWSCPGGAGTIFDQKKTCARYVTVDQLMNEWQIKRLDFIKIDLDGYDARALCGAEQTLQKYKPQILLEVCDYTLRAVDNPAVDYVYGTETRRMLNHLQKFGYRFLWEEDLSPVEKIDDVLTRFNLAERSINLVCVPT